MSNPLVRIIVGIGCFALAWLDGDMRGCAYSINYYACQSSVGKGLDILFMVILASFFIQLAIAIINSIHKPRTFL